MKLAIPAALLAMALPLSWASAPAAPASREPLLHPDRLLVLSTTDVKGKTGPCGCHVPMGGLARRAFYFDSLKASYGQVLVVENGDFFPEDDQRRDAAWFLMDVMRAMGVDAVNLGERDLRFGRAYLEQRAKKIGLPVVSSNLLDPRTHDPLFSPYLLKKEGDVTVGVFGLISNRGELGPARDSLQVADPVATARAMVALLKRQGAGVIVMLSQLGPTDCEDLVSAVDGIDVAIVGHNSPLFAQGRLIKKTIVCYGGDQGHYVGRTEVTLDDSRHGQAATSETVRLGPDVRDNAPIAAMVKSFEDALSAKLSDVKMHEQAQDAGAGGH